MNETAEEGILRLHREAIEKICADVFEQFGLFNGMGDGAISYMVTQIPYRNDWDPTTRFRIGIQIYWQRVYKTARVIRTAKSVDPRFETAVKQKLFALLSVMDIPGSYNYEEE